VRRWDVARPSLTAETLTEERAAGLRDDLVRLGLGAGLAAVGVAAAEVFEDTRATLVERKRRGLDGGMQFTYRNPDRSTDPGRILPGARSLVVGAWSYRRLESAEGGATGGSGETGERGGAPAGRVARYARRDHYDSLRRALGVVARHLSELGWRTAVVCDDNALVDRAAAHRAGIGWFAKNSLLMLDGMGSWFVLGTVVTDAPLPPASPEEMTAHGSGCGACTRCLQACPTGALVAPGVVDARRCLAWLVQAEGSFPEEFRHSLGDRVYGCDACQEVCPINRLAERRDPPPPAEEDAASRVDLLALLGSSDAELLRAHGRWYVPNRDPRYLRRNALVALGNVGDGSDRATRRTLRHWAGVDDPMLAEHARWAAERLGCGGTDPTR
jgi:epoxyqueuosine reductase